jgi:hypothetical protein
MANPRPLKLSFAAILQYVKYRYFQAKSTRSLKKIHEFFSKIWPSSRFGLAMAVLELLKAFLMLNKLTVFPNRYCFNLHPNPNNKKKLFFSELLTQRSSNDF